MSIRQKKIIIFGGTFDPVHNGHISIILESLRVLKADKAIIIPVNIPPHKDMADSSVTSEDRVQMCKLAVFDYPNIEVSDIEVKRKGVSYTVDTLKELREIYKNAEIYFLMGEDMVSTFKQWKSPEEICKLSKICIVPRKIYCRKDIREYSEQIHSMGGDCVIINIPYIDISSTVIRQRLARNNNVSDLISPRVMKYIKEKGLYKSQGKESSL